MPADLLTVFAAGGALAAGAVAALLLLRARAEGRRLRRELRLAEGRLDRLRRELAGAKERLRGAERLSSLGLLAAGVAHEINNPMSYVTSNVRALESALRGLTPVPADLQEYVEEVLPATLEGILRVNTIVADLRRFSREDPGRMEEYDLNAQVQAAVRMARGPLQARCDVQLNLGRVPPAIGKGQQVAQVLVNLLVNAAQATPERGTVTVTTWTDGGELVAEVRDTGTGMAPETLSRLFQPFFTTKPVGEGTGLGLAVAHGIVRSHGGRIEVDSEVGKGSRFAVFLPRVPPQARRGGAEAPRAPAAGLSPSASGSGPPRSGPGTPA